MKKALLAVVVAGALAALCIVQNHKLASQRDQIASLGSQLEQQSNQVESSQAAEKRARAQVRELVRQTDDLAAQLQARQQAEAQAAAAPPQTNPPSAAPAEEVTSAETSRPPQDKNRFGDFIAKMMQDPDTKKFIRDQQRTMIDQLYAPLVKKMGLTPEESASFKDLLADNMMQGAEKASSLFGDSSSNRTDAITRLSADQKDFDARLRNFLGEDRFALYQDYSQTVNERMQLDQFKQQSAGGQNPLTDDQTERLLAIMKEEKQKIAATGQTFPAGGKDKADLQTIMAPEQIEKLLTAQQTLNQDVYQRANEVLTPDQLPAFATFQTNQLQMIRVGMSMAQKMFGSPKAQNDGIH